MMRKISRWVGVTFTVLILCFGTLGCSKGGENTASVSADGISLIKITTWVNDIVVRETQDADITVSIYGHKGELFTQNGDTLTLEMPKQSGIIHFSKPETLYIDLPVSFVGSIKAFSEAGSIQVDGVRAEQIQLTSQYGGIVTKNISGVVSARTGNGEIRSSLALEKQIIASDAGASYDGLVGEPSNVVLTLHCDVGDIAIQ